MPVCSEKPSRAARIALLASVNIVQPRPAPSRNRRCRREKPRKAKLAGREQPTKAKVAMLKKPRKANESQAKPRVARILAFLGFGERMRAWA